MDRRQFHQTVAAAAATLALGSKPSDSGTNPTAVLLPDPLPPGAVTRLGCNRLWHQWPASNPGLNDLTFSPDGRHLASLGYQDDHVFIWSIPDGRAVCDFEPQEVDRGGQLLWAEEGLYVASGGGLSLWEPLVSRLVHRFYSGFQPTSGLAARGDLLAVAAYIASRVDVWDRRSCQQVGQYNTGTDPTTILHWGPVLLSVAFSPC